MPIDLDTLAIIDWFLDEVIELCLLPDTWAEKELNDLKVLHVNILRFNEMWLAYDAYCLSRDSIVDLRNINAALVCRYQIILRRLDPARKEKFAPQLGKLKYYLDRITEHNNYLLFQFNPRNFP